MKKSGICRILDCTEKTRALGICEKHYSLLLKNRDEKGVYHITFKNHDEIYVGKTTTSFKKRLKEHEKYLVQDESRKLLEFFNSLCDKNPHLSRKQVFDEFVEFAPVKGMKGKPFIPFGDWTPEKPSKSRDDDAIEFLVQNKEDVNKFNKLIDSYEKGEIKKYKELDRENGTSFCLNMKD